MTRCMDYSIDYGCPQFCAGSGYWKEQGSSFISDLVETADEDNMQAHCFVDAT